LRVKKEHSFLLAMNAEQEMTQRGAIGQMTTSMAMVNPPGQIDTSDETISWGMDALFLVSFGEEGQGMGDSV
jgi:hypothetical protein